MMKKIYLWSGQRQKCIVAWLLFFVRVGNYHVNICSAAACLLLFWEHSHSALRSHWVPWLPRFVPTIIYYSLCIWVKERGTEWQSWKTWARIYACLELSSHCCWKEWARKLATNTCTQTRQTHTASITGSLQAAPQLLPGLSGILLQCTSLRSLFPIFPREEQWCPCRCCG